MGIVTGFNSDLQNGARLLRRRIVYKRGVSASLKHRSTKGYPSSVGVGGFDGIKKEKRAL